MPPSCIATSRRRCSMARKRASMREGPLAELFKATEAAQRQAEQGDAQPAEEPHESTVEHVPSWEDEIETPGPPRSEPRVEAAPEPEAVPAPIPAPPSIPQPPVTRYIAPLPAPAPRTHRVSADPLGS